MRRALVLLALGSCSDQGFLGRKSHEPSAVDEPADCIELDLDEDGVLDCADDACVPGARAAEEVDTVRACADQPPGVGDPWEAELRWAASEDNQAGCYHTAIADLDADGVGDVLCSTVYGDGAIAYDGATGQALWQSAALADGTRLALGDIDQDGNVDIVGFHDEGGIVALETDGTRKWRSDERLCEDGPDHWGTWQGIQPKIADLDGDGTVEVFTVFGVIDGATGHLVRSLDEAGTPEFSFNAGTAVADLDRDGRQEILGLLAVWGLDGELRWEWPEAHPAYVSMMPIQADQDEGAEVAIVQSGHIRLVDTDGVEIWSRSENLQAYTASCAADADADGLQEIFVNIDSNVVALGPDGVERWRTPMESSGGTNTDSYLSCSVFDLDGDGVPEILAASLRNVYVLDAATGEVRFQIPGVRGFGVDDVLVADLDGDGSAELVVNHGSNVEGEASDPIEVYANPSRAWMPAPPFWSTSNWSGVEAWPDGTIPAVPEAPWLTSKIWRGQPSGYQWGSDLSVEVVDDCVSSCDPDVGVATVSLRLVNLGPQLRRGPIPVSAYDASGAVLVTAFVDADLDVGFASASFEMRFDVATAQAGIRFLAGDPGDGSATGHDCDPTNDALAWSTDACL